MGTLDLKAVTDTTSRDQLRALLARDDLVIGLPQLRRIVTHAQSLQPPLQPLRLGIVHTYTSELLDPWLELAAAVNGLQLETYHSPYGYLVQEADASSGLARHRPDLTVLLLQRTDLHPALADPLSSYDPHRQRHLREEAVQRTVALLQAFQKQDVGHLALSLLPATARPGLGLYDAQSERSEAAWWAGVKSDLSHHLRAMPGCTFLDQDAMLEQIGRGAFFDLRLWYSSRFPYSAAAAREVAQSIVNVGVVLKLPRAKVIVLDADNTLWGGVIGEEGMTGIALGPDYPGSAYVDFQRRLLAYRQRGFILALCSKNNPADVDEVLREHPHQVLKEEHFAARRVNWQSKPENLKALAAELNVGLESFVMVDDSDYECAAIRHELPQVEVVRTPDKPVLVPACLERVARLETLSVTAEDLAKSDLYAQEKKRAALKQELQQDGGDLAAYLASLQMRMQVAVDDARHVKRLAQLTQKTNQFNLTTRRYDEHKISQFIASPEWIVAHFSLQDTFGDSGIVGLALLRRQHADTLELDTFLMSCRVIGRQAEGAFLHWLLRHVRSLGVVRIEAQFIPTAKNGLAEPFLPDQGFEPQGDGRYRFDLDRQEPRPATEFPIVVDGAETASA